MNVQDEKLVLLEMLKAFSLSLDLICNPLGYLTEMGLFRGNEEMIEIAQIEEEQNPDRGRRIIEELVEMAGNIEAHFKDYNDWLAYRKNLEYELEGSEQRYFDLFKD